MSVIGRIGQFLIDYQETIGAIAFIALVAILVVLMVRLIVKNARRKKEEKAERDRLIEELLKVSNDNKEILAALAKVTGIENETCASKRGSEGGADSSKQGSLNEELIKQLESAAGGTVEEVVAKALQTAREYDELTRIKETHEHMEDAALQAEAKPQIDAAQQAEVNAQLTNEEKQATAKMEVELQEQVAEQIHDELVHQFAEPTPQSAPEVVTQSAPEVVTQPAPEVVNQLAPEVATQPAPQSEAAPTIAQPEYFAPKETVHITETEKAEPTRAYTSREVGVDKYGNVYTESMLMDQIG